MSHFSNGKCQDLQKPFPGCMGRMINVFDMSVGMGGTKLLTDKAHRDGSPVRRNHTDAVKKATDPVGHHVEDRANALMMNSELRKNSPSKKSGGTPIKMLIAQEMLKDADTKRKPPSIVAKLMGLDDTLPAHPPVLAGKRSEGYPRSKSAGSLRGRREHNNDYFDSPRSREIHSCSHEKEYRDVYEVHQQQSRTNRFTDQPPQKVRCSENQNEKRMALVREKFIEAKRLASDERLLHSKEFQEALEVLSSNGDLFIKFLEEPNSLFSKHTQESHKTLSLPQTKRITVLKPSKTVQTKGEKHVSNQECSVTNGSGWVKDKFQRGSNLSQPKASISSQTTRIVVLKPSPAKAKAMKAMPSIPISSPELMQQSDSCSGLDSGEVMESREIAKEITRQMKESMSSHRRDESLLSSVLSNGYVGDESSFGKSENEYTAEVGNFSDSEMTTPPSLHSWEYNNRIGSPCSLSSFSRASYSPDSSVVVEAKKRLSERWAMVASIGIAQEQTQVERGSSTLGEMLSIPELKKDDGVNEVFSISSSRSYGGEGDLVAPLACLPAGKTNEGDGRESTPTNLPRSKSVPVSSSTYENIGLKVDPVVPKEVTKSKSGKLSLKGKVSSFFFRNKKSNRQKNTTSPLAATDKITGKSSAKLDKDNPSKSVRDSRHPVNSEEESSKALSPNSGKDESKWRTFYSKAAISVEKPETSENSRGNQVTLGSFFHNPSENQDQPSPISVLDAPFGAGLQNHPSSEIVDAGNPKALSRSVPIGSVARSISWDDTYLEATVSTPFKLLRADEEEHERYVFVQSLLSSSGLDNGTVTFARWHSLESPLDPMLLSKFLDRKEEPAMNREERSSQKLLFDCVNAALLEIGQAAMLGARKDAPISERVWGLVSGWLCVGVGFVSCETNSSTLVVDVLLRREIARREWDGSMRMEMVEISKEIGGKVLDELVAEVLADFICDC